MRTLTELLPIAVEAVDRASLMIRQAVPGAVTIKGDRDPATETDYAVERDIRSFLADEAPNVGFLGEEEGRVGQADSNFSWALDPIDGTVNFMHGIPLCAVSLGLVHGDTPTLGVIELPFLNCRYSALLGAGAFRNNEPIHAAEGVSLRDAVIALGDYAVGEGAEEKNADRIRITQRLVANAQRVRMFGSAAIDLAWVAEGRVGASVMLSNKPWDTAAGVLLAREAGAVVVDRVGNSHTLRSDSTVATSASLVGDLLPLLDRN